MSSLVRCEITDEGHEYAEFSVGSSSVSCYVRPSGDMQLTKLFKKPRHFGSMVASIRPTRGDYAISRSGLKKYNPFVRADNA